MLILTPEAVEDLDHIAESGAEQFGYRQAERYERTLLDAFDSLAVNPRIAREHIVGQRSLRLMPSGRHHILT